MWVVDTALKTLSSCYQNRLTSLDIGDSSELTDVSCSQNGITELDLSQRYAAGELALRK